MVFKKGDSIQPKTEHKDMFPGFIGSYLVLSVEQSRKPTSSQRVLIKKNNEVWVHGEYFEVS